MSGHTLGPWDYDQDDLAIWINATAAGYPEPIAKMGKSARLPQYANARLIAAAPDLLEALEEMLEDYADAALEWDTENKWKALKITRKAYAAIAKARGDGGLHKTAKREMALPQVSFPGGKSWSPEN